MGTAILSDLLARSGREPGLGVASAGTAAVDGQPASPEAVEVMTESGLDLSGHRARRVTAEMLSRARLILAMTRRHREFLLERFPDAADRIHTIKSYAGTAGPGEEEDIVDPLGLGVEAYRRAADELRRAIERIAERLLNPPDLRSLLEGGENGRGGDET